MASQAIAEGRELLIQHLQEKILLLRKQRDQMLNGLCADTQPANIGNKNGNAILTEPVLSSFKEAGKEDVHRPVTGLLPHRVEMAEVKARAAELSKLYQQKKQLQGIGREQNDPTKIRQLLYRDQIKKELVRKARKNERESALAIQACQKRKIIAEELQRTRRLLQESKCTHKVVETLQKMHYTYLLSQQQDLLKEYASLLTSKVLSITRKERLLRLSFDLLKEYPEKITKGKLKDYLLANPQFSTKFFITNEEINRDLEVHETVEKGFLSYLEFYEFIRSIELTNPLLKPALNQELRRPSKVTPVRVQDKRTSSKASPKDVQLYFLEIFRHIDYAQEHIVQRQKLVQLLAKGYLLDGYTAINRKDVVQFSEFINEVSVSEDHYKQLDLKFIGYEEMMELYRLFSRQQNQASPQKERNGEKMQKNIESDAQKADQPGVEVFQQPIKDQNLQAAFEVYGWTPPTESKPTDLHKFDKIYREMSARNATQIEWNGFGHYQQDFSKFEECVKLINADTISRVT